MTLMLPLGRHVRWGGPGLILLLVLLSLLLPAEAAWRLTAASAIFSIGAVSWAGYLRRRPVSMTIKTDGGLVCGLADGSRVEVVGVMRGFVHPRWLTARLRTRDGRHRDLLLSRGAVSGQVHRQMRQALMGFRPPDE